MGPVFLSNTILLLYAELPKFWGYPDTHDTHNGCAYDYKQ